VRERGGDRRVVGSHPGARHHQVGRLGQRGELGAVGGLAHLGTQRARPRRARLVGLTAGCVVGDHDVVTLGARVLDDGGAGAREADHQDPHQSIAPGMPMKSA
jgi:hypothetical protein